MHIVHAVGARPNFMKAAPVIGALNKAPGVSQYLVHTGQHYDSNMSGVFFAELGLPVPDIDLEVGSGSHVHQLSLVLQRFETVLVNEKPDLVMVYGDVNSTLACALTAVKLNVPVAHVEAGLRSGNRSMPEEINRILTDQISDYLFVTEKAALENLSREGVAEQRMYFVGNVMVDTLLKNLEKARSRNIAEAFGLPRRSYLVCTIHRPSNVDTMDGLLNTIQVLEIVADRLPVVFPVHPRTVARIREASLWEQVQAIKHLKLVEPLGYLDFLALMEGAKAVFTDSGGIQEETTALGIPCITYREETERPITVWEGTNRVIGTAPEAVASAIDDLMAGKHPKGRVPELWDGHAAERGLPP